MTNAKETEDQTLLRQEISEAQISTSGIASPAMSYIYIQLEPPPRNLSFDNQHKNSTSPQDLQVLTTNLGYNKLPSTLKMHLQSPSLLLLAVFIATASTKALPCTTTYKPVKTHTHTPSKTRTHSHQTIIPTCDPVFTCGNPVICPPQDPVICIPTDHKCKIATTCTWFVICDNVATPCGGDNVTELCVDKSIPCRSLAGYVP
jgi:hypothetical protein